MAFAQLFLSLIELIKTSLLGVLLGSALVDVWNGWPIIPAQHHIAANLVVWNGWDLLLFNLLELFHWFVFHSVFLCSIESSIYLNTRSWLNNIVNWNIKHKFLGSSMSFGFYKLVEKNTSHIFLGCY